MGSGRRVYSKKEMLSHAHEQILPTDWAPLSQCLGNKSNRGRKGAPRRKPLTKQHFQILEEPVPIMERSGDQESLNDLLRYLDSKCENQKSPTNSIGSSCTREPNISSFSEGSRSRQFYTYWSHSPVVSGLNLNPDANVFRPK